MADTTLTWKRKLLIVAPWLLWAGTLAAWIGGGCQGPPPFPPIVDEQKQPPAVIAEPQGGDVPAGCSTGWVFDAGSVATNLDPEQTLQFAATPAGKAAMGEEDRFLWRAVRKVNNRAAPWYPNVNQETVGCCVGCGWKHGADVCQATSILTGVKASWKPVSVEVIYGGSRVEVGGGRIRSDGSIGAWAAKWCRDWGLVPMEKIGEYDLTAFSPARARDWGRSGCPDALEPAAKLHPIKSTALVRTWADVQRAIGQDYPVVVCSDQGFTMSRDKDGFASPRGAWAHCMVIIGIRGGQRPGAFILNSWGDKAHTGPVWPEDAPVAGFWADTNVIDRMVKQGDSFALSDVIGFPSRKLIWDVLSPMPREVERPVFALAP